ncbi:MAG: hypothetical protein QNJ15_08640 [Erythrobacter sp.]|nr:hypothetical protein [Erythrobacter sp.]
MSDRMARVRMVAVAWIAVWPTITLLLTIVEPLARGWPLPLRTLLVSAVMVPAMVLVLFPAIDRLLSLVMRFNRRTVARHRWGAVE